MILLYKNKGETPLQALDRLRVEKPELEKERLSYAGRLDPMAEGLLLVLVGDENNKREDYIGLSKTYEVDILFGIETDTLDILGKVEVLENIDNFNKEKVISLLTEFNGEIDQSYPKFSSKTFLGKPLFLYTREGKEVPDIKHKVFIKNIEFIKESFIKSGDLLTKIKEDVSKVSGDFRQEEILEIWQEKLQYLNTNFPVLSFKMEVSSGFYVRQFAKDLGNKLGLKTVSLNIKRLQVGDFSI